MSSIEADSRRALLQKVVIVLATAVLCISLLGGLLLLLCSRSANDEIRSKSEWMFLQGALLKHQETKKPDREAVVFEMSDDYHAIGIWSDQSASLVWVLLDPRAKPFLKMMPEATIFLTQKQLSKILASYPVHPEVRSYLVGRTALAER